MAERVVVAMSGGVDSSVAAALLVEAGLDVVGVTLKVWPAVASAGPVRHFGSCCGTEAVADARRVARALGIPHFLLDSAEEFEHAVIDDFVTAYRGGRTPVPCLACNSELKFGSLLRRAHAWDASSVATGHYARVTTDPPTGRRQLRRARDPHKDQTYFLWPLTQRQLDGARFPVGDLTKAAVRERARDLGLVTAEKPESQEICFIPDGDYRKFLRSRSEDVVRPGKIVDVDGRELGDHEGVANYTVGQRRGLGLATGRALYVVDLDAAKNVVTVGDLRDLAATRLTATRTSFVDGAGPPGGEARIEARIRHSHVPAPARLAVTGPDRAEVEFDEPQRAVTPGQSVVFYQGDLVLGGGIIASR